MFKKEDLKYFKYYEWTESNPFEKNELTLTDTFVKFDGYYALALINLISKKYDLKKINECHELEDAISVCPSKYTRIDEMVKWIEVDMGRKSWLDALKENI